jgi:hypothetical protein
LISAPGCWVGVSARGNETPEPCECRAQDVEHGEDAVELAVAMGCRTANAEAAHVDGAWSAGDVFEHAAWKNDSRVGAKLAGLVFDVLPGEASPAGDDVVIEKDERFGWIDAEALEVWRRAVAVDVIDADEPCVFGVGDGEPAVLALVARMGTGHVVGDGTEMTGFRKVERALFVRDDVSADEQAAIFHAVDVLGHFAFATAAGAFVHEDQLVFVRGDDGNC